MSRPCTSLRAPPEPAPTAGGRERGGGARRRGERARTSRRARARDAGARSWSSVRVQRDAQPDERAVLAEERRGRPAVAQEERRLTAEHDEDNRRRLPV